MRVLAAMSGGVDSSVAAARMVDAGHEVVGVHLALSHAPGALRTLTQAVDGHQAAASLDALGLTPRQTEVLHLLLQGKPNKLIARDLKLSVETIKDHVAAVLRSLNVSSRTQAVLAIGELTRPPVSPSGRRKNDP